MTIVLVLYVVFFALWVFSCSPPAATWRANYGGWLGVICVGLLGWQVFHGALH